MTQAQEQVLDKSIALNRRKAFSFQVAYSVIEEFVFGFFVLAEVILRRELGASDFFIALFTMINPVSSITSVYFSGIVSRNPGKISSYIIKTALLTRFPAILFLVWHTKSSLLLFGLLFNVGLSFIKPVQNIMMQENYKPDEIGKLYGYSVAFGKIASLVSVYLFGTAMDLWNTSYIYIFPVCGILGMVSMSALLFIPFSKWKKESAASGKFDYLIFPTIKKTFSENRLFYIFEKGFFVYGGGFMVVLTAMPVLFVDYMNLSYSMISLGKGVVASIVVILFTPFFGKLFDKSNPAKMAKKTFFLLAFYPLFILLSYFSGGILREYLFYLAFAIFGMGMASVSILWNVGPMNYAKNPMEISKMTSIHVTMTGVRGLVWPMAGYFLLQISVFAPFIASILFFLAASNIMRKLEREETL